jgi:predicted NAD/FAD-dependent oxidoreductase
MKIAIIGAGFSGCNLYDNLRLRFDDITIFEKSRGVGGRLSTKYIGDKFIDHGTSRLLPITEDLKEFCLDLSKNAVLRARYDEFFPKEGINKICKFLIDDNDLKTNTKITSAKLVDNKWNLKDENGNSFEGFDKLFLTIPATQILQMDITLEDSIKSQLQTVSYDSVFTLILYSNNKKIENISKIFENENVEDIIDNSRKYFYKDFNSYVIHSTKDFANSLNQFSKEEISDRFLNSFSEEIKKELEKLTIIPHLWKFAFAKTSLDIPYYLNEDKNLGICGDYFNYNNLESALLSSELLGNLDL